MTKSLKKDVTHLHSTDAIAERLSRVMEEDEIEAGAQEQAMKPYLEKNYWVQGTTLAESKLIQRIDKAGKNRSELSWEEKSAVTQKEIKESREAEKKHQKELKKIKWEDPNQPWDNEPETFDERLDKWNKQTEELAKDFNK